MLQDPTNTAAAGGTGIAGWRTNPTVPVIEVPAATLALIVAPSAGEVGVASEAFVVAVNGDSDGDVVITPSIVSGGAGTFTPTTATVNSASALYDTFTFTPSSVAEYVLQLSNDRGLTNPATFGYSSQSPAPPPLDLSTRWVTDLHPMRPWGASQGVVPADCALYAGDANSFNLQSQYAGEGNNSFSAATAVVQGDGDTVDSNSLERNGYETLQIITDPDNALRNCYRMRVSQAASGWVSTASGRIRAQISATGTARNTRAWGTDTWLVLAVRIPAAMKSMAPQSGTYNWQQLFEYHHYTTTDIAVNMALEFRGGGAATPQNAQLFMRVNHQTAPDPVVATKYDYPLFAGGASDEVPEDEWIYFVCNWRMWHGYPDPSTSPVATPTGDFYCRPFVAVADGPAVPKAGHEGLWGVPFVANAVGWSRPHYGVCNMYSNPLTFVPDPREVLHLGMQEYLVSDNPDPVTRPWSAQDILQAFKASRLVTPA